MKALHVVLAVLGACLFTCAGGAWLFSRSEAGQHILGAFSLLGKLNDAVQDTELSLRRPGTLALREMGCEMATVQDGAKQFEDSRRALAAVDGFLDDEERAEGQAALQTEWWKSVFDPRIVFCRVPDGDTEITCSRVAETYRQATGYDGWIQAMAVDSSHQGCTVYYDPEDDEIAHEKLAALHEL